MNYLDALTLLHGRLAPLSYVEIGCREGRSLSLAHCPAIAIDPDFEIRFELRSPTRIFRTTSDEFFANEQLDELIGGPVDLAFVDGMHRAEFALRDILNLEKFSLRDTVIVVDDVLPQQIEWTTRERNTQAWTGDVYKVIPFLRQNRPDLDIRVFDIETKGMAVITNFDPGNRAVADRLAEHEADLAGDKWAYSTIEALRAAIGPEPVDAFVAYLNSLQEKRRAAHPTSSANPRRQI